MALTDKLSAIGAAIREKGGTTELLTLAQMPDAIAALPTGGGGEDPIPNPLVYDGNLSYALSYGHHDWVLNNYYSRLQFKDVTNMDHTFYYSNVKKLPTITQTTSSLNWTYTFHTARELEEIEGIVNFYPMKCDKMFQGCVRLRNCPPFTGTIQSQANANYTQSYMFSECYSLRNVDENLLKSFKTCSTTATYNLYSSMFNNCSSLDEINKLGVLSGSTLTSNMFAYTFVNCHRLKKITFNLNEDGTPIVAKWKNQTIDLTKYVGWAGEASATSKILNYNSGITAEDEDNDWSNNPNYWSKQFANSRFNHDSAVELINSLPDTSAYLATQTSGTNSVKFYTNAGINTPGGSVNDLTEEEIAVAAAKGWTIAYGT